MTKKARISLIVVASVVAIIFVALMIYFFGARYPDFDKLAKKEFAIPGLDTSFVPQGLEYDSQNQIFLVSGYMSDNSASRIYVVDRATGQTLKYITLQKDGADYSTHFGGVAVYNDIVWVAGDKELATFSLTDLISAQNAGKIALKSTIATGNGCDFVLTKGNQLIVGEFYRAGSYETPVAHHINTTNGKNYALAYIYNINESYPIGFASTVPAAVLSLPNQVQGMSFNKDGNIILSTSYSVPDSVIYTHQNVFANTTTQTINLFEQDIPLYVLDDNTLRAKLVAPAMAEEVVLVEDRVYVLFESACQKYKLVNRTRTTDVLSLDI